MLSFAIFVILFQYSSQYQDQSQLTLQNPVDQSFIEQTSDTQIKNDSEDHIKQELPQSQNKFLMYIQSECNYTITYLERITKKIHKHFTFSTCCQVLIIAVLMAIIMKSIIKKLKEQSNVKKKANQIKESQILINDLYDQSWRKREIEPQFLPFLREQENEQSFRQEYCKRQINFEECNAFIPVRGDGNCFYTAFGYQFLKILITEYDDQEYISFVERAKMEIKFMINYENSQISEKQGILLSQEFFQRIENLRNSDDKQNKLFNQYQNYQYIDQENDGILYGLATIFFRNLANYALEFNEFKEQVKDRNNLLIWEVECNDNEIVIDSLSKYLKLQILVLFSKNQEIKQQCYGQEYPYKIILLLKPGHYNIGLKL